MSKILATGKIRPGVGMTTEILVSVLAALGTLGFLYLYRYFLARFVARFQDQENPEFQEKATAMARAEIKAEEKHENGEISDEQLRKQKNRLSLARRSLYNEHQILLYRKELVEREREVRGSGLAVGGRLGAGGEDSQRADDSFFRLFDEPRFRILVATIISALALPVCFFVVLSGSKFDATARNFASGTIGALLGFWLKP